MKLEHHAHANPEHRVRTIPERRRGVLARRLKHYQERLSARRHTKERKKKPRHRRGGVALQSNRARRRVSKVYATRTTKTKNRRVSRVTATHRVSRPTDRKTRRIGHSSSHHKGRRLVKAKNPVVRVHAPTVAKVRRVKKQHPRARHALTATERAAQQRALIAAQRRRTATFGGAVSFKLGRLAPYRPPGLLGFDAYCPLFDPVTRWTGPQDADFDYGMLGNDTHGTCEFAGFVHGSAAVSMILGLKPKEPTADEVVAAYLEFTGGEDIGCVTFSVLHELFLHGILGIGLDGFAPLDGDVLQLCSAIQLCGTAQLGVLVSKDREQQFLDRVTWDASRRIPRRRPHTVYAVGFDLEAETVDVITWGLRQRVTFAWLEQNVEEKWAVVFTQIQTAGGVDGYQSETLQADLSRL